MQVWKTKSVCADDAHRVRLQLDAVASGQNAMARAVEGNLGVLANKKRRRYRRRSWYLRVDRPISPWRRRELPALPLLTWDTAIQ
jgi:hypothetical protein